MQNILFSTASNIALFLNGVHVDMAYALSYRDNSPAIPLYGYNDFEFSSIARGKRIVQGSLICNFVYPAYLSAILDAGKSAYSPRLYNYNILENSSSIKEQFKTTLAKKLETELPSFTDDASRAARAAFISSLISTKDSEQRARTKEALIKFMTPGYDEPQASSNRDIANPLSITTSSKKGNEMDLYYQDPEFAAYFVRFKNVEFTETSQQMSQAGAEGSSEPLYMIHQFIAKSIEIKQVT